MIRDTIFLKDVLKIMESGDAFSIRFVTCNRRQRTGGKIVLMDNAVQLKKDEQAPVARVDLPAATAPGKSKNPRHWQNSTRNIRCYGTIQYRKVHIRLIIEFNSKKVIW